MPYELTEKEQFIRKFWLILLSASCLLGPVLSYYSTPPTLFTTKVILISAFSSLITWLLSYYLVYKKHNNAIPFIAVYFSPLSLFVMFLGSLFIDNPTYKYQALQFIPTLVGVFAYWYFCKKIRFINHKIRFQKKSPEGYRESITQLETVASIDQLNGAVTELRKKFPKFKLFFKDAYTENAKRFS